MRNFAMNVLRTSYFVLFFCSSLWGASGPGGSSVDITKDGGITTINATNYSGTAGNGNQINSYRSRGSKGTPANVQAGDLAAAYLSYARNNAATWKAVGGLRFFPYSDYTGAGDGYAVLGGSVNETLTDSLWTDGLRSYFLGGMRLVPTGTTDHDSLSGSTAALLTLGTESGTSTFTADTNGTDIYAVTQTGGAHTSNNPRGADFRYLMGGAGSGGTGRAGRMLISQSGDIVPDSLLHIYLASAGTFSTSDAALTLENSGDTILQFASPNTATQSIRFGDTGSVQSGLLSYNHNTDSFQLNTAGTLRALINASAARFDVGISLPDGSASSPGGRFTNDTDSGIYRIGSDNFGFATGGSVRASVSNTSFNTNVPIYAVVGSAAAPGYSSADSDTGINLPGSNVMTFSTGGSERARIDSAGNVGFGVTPSSWGSLYSGIDIGSTCGIFATKSGSGTTFILNNAYYNGANYIYKNNAGSQLTYFTENQISHLFAPSGTAGNTATFTERFRVEQSTGDTYTNDGTISSLSDARLKRNVVSIDGNNSLQKLTALRPVTFQYKENAGLAVDDGKTRRNFIAQEVAAVAPEFTGETKVKLNGEDTVVGTVSTTRMIPDIIAAMQVMKNKIDQLEAQITALEAAKK